MAFAVNEHWSGRRGSGDLKAVREYTRVFRAVGTWNDRLAGPLTVSALVGVLVGDSYVGANGETDPGSYCRRVSVNQLDEPYHWEIVCDYSSEASDTDNAESDGQPEDPIQRVPKIRWGLASFTRPAQEINGAPLSNSAGEPYDPVPEMDDARLTLSYTRNETSYDPARALQYVNAVNSDTWTFQGNTFASGVAKCVGITTGDLQFENGISYFEVTYEFHFAKPTNSTVYLDSNGNPLVVGDWDLYLLDQGHYSVTAPVSPGSQPPVRKYPKDANDGTPLKDLVLLDGNGGLLADSANEVYNRFQIYRKLPFAALALT